MSTDIQDVGADVRAELIASRHQEISRALDEILQAAAFGLSPSATWDAERCTWVVKHEAGYVIEIVPEPLTWALVLTPEGHEFEPVGRWYYGSAMAAEEAAQAWDVTAYPDVEPQGWHRRAEVSA